MRLPSIFKHPRSDLSSESKTESIVPLYLIASWIFLRRCFWGPECISELQGGIANDMVVDEGSDEGSFSPHSIQPRIIVGAVP